MAPWKVVVEVSEASQRQPLVVTGVVLLVGIVLATLAGLLAGHFGARRIAQGVHQLVESVPDQPLGIAELEQARLALQANAQAREAVLGALQRSEAMLRAVFEQLPDAVILVDSDRRITLVNPAFTRLFGHPAHEAIGRRTDFLYDDPADFAETDRTRFVRQGLVDERPYLMRYRRRDGSTFWGESTAMRVVTADGKPVGLLGLHRDVSARRQAEEALKRSRAQLEAFVNQAPLAIALFDREMNYLATSAQWVRQYGGAGQDLVGLNHYALVPDLPQAWKEAHRRGLAGETLRNDSDYWQRADGTELWLRWVVQPWTDETGAVDRKSTRLNSSHTDISRMPSSA